MKKRVQGQKHTGAEFASVLKRLRIEAGLSQGDVRKALGYTSAQFVSNWERGLSIPPVETLGELAVFYSIPSEQLFKTYLEYRLRNLEAEIQMKISKLPKKPAKKTTHRKSIQ